MSVTAHSPDHAPEHGGLPGGLALDPAGVAWFVIAIVSALPLFRIGLAGLATEWARPEYSHGPVIPVLSFYMFLREMKFVPPPSRPVTDRWPGVLVIGLGLLVALVGNLVEIDDLVFYALIVWVGGLVLVSFGFRRGFLFWPAVLHLVFMLPLPQFLYWKINTTLQFFSSEIGVAFVRVMDVPVFLDGNVIDLGVYKLMVAEACSGLRYLFPIMSFSYVFAVLYTGARWHKAVLLLSAMPIAILMNALRIGVIGVLVDRYGIGQAEGFLHFFEGWVIFLSCIAILFLMVRVMQRLSGDRRPIGEAIDLDFSGLGHQLARVKTMAPSRALIVAALTTAALSAAWSLAPTRAAEPAPRDPFALFPLSIAGWEGAPAALAPKVEEELEADDYLSAFFRNPAEAEGVDLFLSYYASQTQGSAIHSPAVCLPGAGWEVAAIRPMRVELPGTPFGSFTLNRAVIQKGLDRQLVYYWFAQRGRHLTNEYLVKWYLFIDGLTRNRTDGALVRLVTPLGRNEPEEAADARLGDFLRDVFPRLNAFVPD